MKKNPDHKTTRTAAPKVKSQAVAKVNEKANDKLTSRRAGSQMNIPSLKKQLTTEVEELRERFLFIIETWSAEKYRYEWLENRTGISAARWQHVCLEKQLPTLEMIIAICNLQPEYTYWLMRGTQQKWVKEGGEPGMPVELEGPSIERFNKYRTDREWIKERRRINISAKKALQTIS